MARSTPTGLSNDALSISMLHNFFWVSHNRPGAHISLPQYNIQYFDYSHISYLISLPKYNIQYFDYSSAEYRVIAIILDIANFRLFRPVRSDVPAQKTKHFMKIKFFNKAVDAINLPALLRSTSVTNKIPVYFRDKEPPIVSYEYTSTVASKLFNFAPALSNLNVSEYFSNPQTCQCKESKFCYEPHGHVITGDLRVIENAKLRELVGKGPKYREPNRVKWKATETMFLESIDLYPKNWSKREQVDLKYLSEWKDQLKDLVADRISSLKGHFKSPKCKVLDQPDVKDTLNNYMPIMFWSLQTKLPIM